MCKKIWYLTRRHHGGPRKSHYQIQENLRKKLQDKLKGEEQGNSQKLTKRQKEDLSHLHQRYLHKRKRRAHGKLETPDVLQE